MFNIASTGELSSSTPLFYGEEAAPAGDLQGREAIDLTDWVFVEEPVVKTAVATNALWEQLGSWGAFLRSTASNPVVAGALQTSASYLAYRVGLTATATVSTQIAWWLMATAGPAVMVGPLAPIGACLGTFGPHITWLIYGVELRNKIEVIGGSLAAASLSMPYVISALKGAYATYFQSAEGQALLGMQKIIEKMKQEGKSEEVLAAFIEQFKAMDLQSQLKILEQYSN